MANIKKYYWLKLNENFFEDDTIQFIEEQENGILYSNFYMKLCLKSLKQAGTLVRVVGETLIPYDIKSLSKLTGVPSDTVAVAMDLFKTIGLVKVLESGEIYLSQIEEMIGSETDKAKSMRMLRAIRRDDSNNVTKMLPTVTKSYPEIEIELEKEKDIDKKIEKDNGVCDNDIKKTKRDEGYTDDFLIFWRLYDKIINKKKTFVQWKKKQFTTEELEEVMKKVKLYVDNTEKRFRKDPERYVRDNCWENEVIIKTNVNRYGKPEPKNISTAIKNTQPVDEWEEYNKMKRGDK